MFGFWDDVTSGVVSGTAAALIWAGIVAGFVKWRDGRKLKELVDSVKGSSGVGCKMVEDKKYQIIVIRNDTGWPLTIRAILVNCDKHPSVWLQCVDDLELDKSFTIKPKAHASWGAPTSILHADTVTDGWADIDYTTTVGFAKVTRVQLNPSQIDTLRRLTPASFASEFRGV